MTSGDNRARAVVHFDLASPRSWRDDASNPEAWDDWDRKWRASLGWHAGLKFWGKTNMSGSRVLISRHWPHRLCWSWSVWLRKHRPGFDGERKIGLCISRRYRYAYLLCWWWQVDVNWQNYDWMPAFGYRENAPQLYWRHHLEHADPAGRA